MAVSVVYCNVEMSSDDLTPLNVMSQVKSVLSLKTFIGLAPG